MNTAPRSRILIVDDEAAQMRALCDTLRDHGYETTGCTAGAEALKRLEQQGFDLLLTDLTMPDMDGVALLVAARRIDPHLIGIMMTGMGTIETAVKAMQAGALDYILKPFKISAILPVLSRATEMRRLRLENLELQERKRAEQEVRTLNAVLELRVAERTQQLETANRIKSDFIANMSHELRTPLNAIIGFSELLKEDLVGTLNEEQHRFVTDIYDSGQHLLLLINDILDLSKIEAGMLELAVGAVDIGALLEKSLLVVREKAQAHRITLRTQIDPALGPVLTDERKLKQIVYNLLSNAVKFTPDGGAVTLHARRCPRAAVALDPQLPGRMIGEPGADAEAFLEIEVEDTGAGIAADQLSKLFEPFVQADPAIATKYGGTGLGLALVRRLAEMHGGTVGVDSRPGVGSRFHVWLPWRAPPPIAPKAQS